MWSRKIVSCTSELIDISMNMDYSNPSDQENYDKELLDNLNSSALIAFIVNRTCGDSK